MVNLAFQFARIPKIRFGSGVLIELHSIVRGLGRTVLVVTGGSSFASSGRLDLLFKSFESQGIKIFHLTVDGEPSPEVVDRAVKEYRDRGIHAVVAVGGGSVMDAGKAVSAMLLQEGSVVDYLEGVGTGVEHSGKKVPLVAVPTTAGTGSEATKNAVLSRPGPQGFKKSLRHDNFVPDVVLLDPKLMLSCPPFITAACGMDAFTQLLESYVSTKASPMTDALALSGLEHIGASLVLACTHGAGDENVRASMAYAALMSGITLANAGLGLVHGLASAIGGGFDIPHGVVCGTLMGAVNAFTIQKLTAEQGPEHPALKKYARVGALLKGMQTGDVAQGCEMLLETIASWTETLKIPHLGEYGIRESDFDGILAGSGNKNNPLPLGADEIRGVLKERL